MVLAQNRFDDVASVALIGLSDATVVENVLSGARGPALILSQTKQGLVAGNVVECSYGSAGVKVTAAARGLQVSGNLVTGGAANGLQIDRASRKITLTGNGVDDNAATGVAGCLAVLGLFKYLNFFIDSFGGALKAALHADVLNGAEQGSGPVNLIDACLASSSFSEAPPKVLIWEFPLRYLTDPALWDGHESGEELAGAE